MFRLEENVSIPKRVSDALNHGLIDSERILVNVSIPKRVSDALNLTRLISSTASRDTFQSLKGFQML